MTIYGTHVCEKSLDRIVDIITSAGAEGIQQGEIVTAMGYSLRYIQKALQDLRKLGRVCHVKSQRFTRFFTDMAHRDAYQERWNAEMRERREATKEKRLEKSRLHCKNWREKKRAERAQKPKALRAPRRMTEQVEKAARAPREPKQPKPRKSRAKMKPEPKFGAQLVVRASATSKADPFKTAEAVIPEGVKVTVCPGHQDNRFTVQGPVVGGFATMRPGQYLPGESWASKALGAAA